MPDLTEKQTFSDQEALDFHRIPTPGKISMAPTKPMATQRDLSLAYSPGVAVPVLAIAQDADKAYEYTSKGNLVAVISNGTAILGLGNLGHMASKPVMEGKSVLFKRFADVDSFDVQVKTTDPDEFITVVKNIGDTWGGINLEDIKSPECFVIESELQDLLDIPVFHDDQHGTAIISTAGLINACHVAGKRLDEVKVVLAGAGAAGLSSIALMKAAGVKAENTVICDKDGVVYKGREHGMDQWKAAHATDTPHRTLAEAMVGADVVLGLSAKGAITKEMVASMAPNPIIFAMANPDPEITPEDVKSVRSDAIIATGRSDYVNQVNNVLAFPYLFRGALDVRARRVNHEMKVACAQALAALAREDVPDEVAAAYRGRKLKFGPDYIIPTPFDPRLIWYIPPFVAQAAMDSGVARVQIDDMDAYRNALRSRVDPSAALMQKINSAVRGGPNKRIVFAEGEEPAVIRAAWGFKQADLGTPILVGREDLIRQNAAEAGLNFDDLGIEITNARVSGHNVEDTDWLYEKLQRRGYLRRDVQRMINQDRNYFAATLVAKGRADAMVAGVTRNFNMALKEVQRVLDVDDTLIGLSILLAKGRTLFVADTTIHELPDAAELADIAIKAAETVRKLGRNPRVAFLSYSTFGNPPGDRAEKVREAIRILDKKGVDFEYEGEMPPEVALDPKGHPAYAFN
ncbi:NADP-dependent malic enzyme, partial [Brevundimonas sp.]|uniref:NADP-dependent malic enzyme n=2 Tax=Brevundimonas TaxID=41275 RepID=UPI00257FA1E5